MAGLLRSDNCGISVFILSSLARSISNFPLQVIKGVLRRIPLLMAVSADSTDVIAVETAPSTDLICLESV